MSAHEVGLENQLTGLLNLVNSYIGHGREDGAMAILSQALELSRENGLPVWEFTFTFQACTSSARNLSR
jgi:hypothetical protein